MTNGTISLVTCDRDNKYWLAWMEATMPSSITQLVIGIAAAIGMAAVSVGAIGNDTAAQSTVEQTQASAKGASSTVTKPSLRSSISGLVIINS